MLVASCPWSFDFFRGVSKRILLELGEGAFSLSRSLATEEPAESGDPVRLIRRLLWPRLRPLAGVGVFNAKEDISRDGVFAGLILLISFCLAAMRRSKSAISSRRLPSGSIDSAESQRARDQSGPIKTSVTWAFAVYTKNGNSQILGP
jgi:hypothetical protein